MKNNKLSALSMRLTKYKYIALALAILLAFVPKLYSSENQVGIRAVATCVGIDKTDDGYELSAQIFMPNSADKGYNKSVIKTEAKSIGEAVSSLTVKSGRVIDIAHCNLIILSKDIMEDDCVAPLDYFLRNGLVSGGALVAGTDNPAFDTVSDLNKLEKTASFSWQKFYNILKQSIQSKITELRVFVNDCYDEDGVSFLTAINLKAAKSGGEGGNDGSEGGGEESAKQASAHIIAAQSDPSKELVSEIDDNGKTFVIKNGRLAGELSREETYGFSLLEEHSTTNIFSVDKIDSDFYKDARVTVKLKDKKVRIKYKFREGKPVPIFKITASFEEVEVVSGNVPIRFDDEERNEAREKLSARLTEVYCEYIMRLYEKCVELDADCMRLNGEFYKRNPRAYKNFMQTGTRSSFLAAARPQFDMKIRIII